MLRFRCTQPSPGARKYAAYSTIAKGLRMATYNQVQHICRTALRPSKPLSGDKLVRKLGPEHVQFLTSMRTLEQWSGVTMKQRTVLFHRRFPDKRIAVTTLRRLYLRHGIRRKKVRLEKTMTQRVRRNFVQNCERLLADESLAECGARLCHFSTGQLLRQAVQRCRGGPPPTAHPPPSRSVALVACTRARILKTRKGSGARRRSGRC